MHARTGSSAPGTRREFLKTVGLGTAVFGLTHGLNPRGASTAPPNFIVILCDNLGYGDPGCFGSTVHRTPNVDRMAAEGTRLTSFYATSGVCTPSRASLMTGCYPRRVNMHASSRGGAVLRPVDAKGLNPSEITVAEVLKRQGYATACIGKWHLGDQPPFLPTRQGFDEYFGIPYSDDMVASVNPEWPPLPLMRNERVVEAPADRNTLTRRYTEEAIRFIEANRARPFFLYLAHAMPGSTPRPFASERFRGKSANGPYGDSVEELDWSTGRILAALQERGLDERTLIVWTSDNGAPRRDPPQGSNRPLGGWGYTTMEGGMRVPCIVRWPGRVPAGKTCDELATTMDLMPTFAHLAGTQPPADRRIDGRDIRPLLFGRAGAKSPYEVFYYYHMEQLQAVRAGKWKLHLVRLGRGRAKKSDRPESEPPRLYDLQTDIGETTDVSARHPDVVRRLSGLAEEARKDLGDLGREGENQRPAGRVDNPTPRVPLP
jgi:arylsulfatase A-like enzyme